MDQFIALGIVTVVGVTGLILYLHSDIRAASLNVGSSEPVPSPAASTPDALRELWGASTDPALGAVVSPTGVVVTTNQHGVTALDATTGEQRWSYDRSNRDLCAVGSGDVDPGAMNASGRLHGIVAVYQNDDWCTDVQSFDANDGTRGEVRTSPLQKGGQLLFGGNVSGWWAPTLVEVWRYDLFRMIRYGIEPNPTNSGTQHLGCTFTDMALALDQFATIEHCADEGPNARVVLNFNDPNSKKTEWSPFEFDPRIDVDTGSPSAVVVGITTHRVLVLVSSPSPALVLYDAAGTELSRQHVEVTAEEIATAANGRPLPRLVTSNASYALVGNSLLVMDHETVNAPAPSTALETATATTSAPSSSASAPPSVRLESLTLRYVKNGALGLPAEMADTLLIPVDGGLLKTDLNTEPSPTDGVLPIERGGYSGTIAVHDRRGLRLAAGAPRRRWRHDC